METSRHHQAGIDAGAIPPLSTVSWTVLVPLYPLLHCRDWGQCAGQSLQPGTHCSSRRRQRGCLHPALLPPPFPGMAPRKSAGCIPHRHASPLAFSEKQRACHRLLIPGHSVQERAAAMAPVSSTNKWPEIRYAGASWDERISKERFYFPLRAPVSCGLVQTQRLS